VKAVRELVPALAGGHAARFMTAKGVDRARPEKIGSHTVRVAHLALQNTNPNPLVEGPMLMLAPFHGKVRRAGYRKTAAL